MRKKIFSSLTLIVVYNLILYLQNYFQSELQFYFFGFRLNFFLLTNLLLIYFSRDKLFYAQEYLRNLSSLKNWILIFVLPIIFSGIILLYINFNGVLKYKNPDYLVEFGLTSLLDLPIYYLWTLPLVASFFLVAIILSEKFSFHRSLFLSILFTLSVLLVKIDLLENKFKLEDLTIFALIFGFVFYQLSVLKKFKSIWIACFSFLVTIYSYVLVFGSKNSFIIKTFFARTYSEWEGLFSIKKINLSTLDLISSGLFVLLAIFFFIFDRRK